MDVGGFTSSVRTAGFLEIHLTVEDSSVPQGFILSKFCLDSFQERAADHWQQETDIHLVS